MEPRISIITLGVTDLPRAVEFYRDGLGLPLFDEKPSPLHFSKTGAPGWPSIPRSPWPLTPVSRRKAADFPASPWLTKSAPERRWTLCWT